MPRMTESAPRQGGAAAMQPDTEASAGFGEMKAIADAACDEKVLA